MYADSKKSTRRRFKRRLKAVASIALALCAGTFLACTRDDTTDAPAPDADAGSANKPPAAQPPDSSPGATATATGSASAVDAGAPVGADAGTDASPDAGKAIAPRPSSNIKKWTPPPRPRPSVDRKEHRKGMPVIDNLVE